MRTYTVGKKNRMIRSQPVHDDSRLPQKTIDHKAQDQTNTQENKQDMDQNQEVDVKPAQFVSVTINNQIEKYTGKITGYIYKEIGREGDSVKIIVYFGNDNKYPIYQADLDKNRNFIIEELPPGFYMIEIYQEEQLLKKIPNVKVLPGQATNQSVVIDE